MIFVSDTHFHSFAMQEQEQHVGIGHMWSTLQKPAHYLL